MKTAKSSQKVTPPRRRSERPETETDPNHKMGKRTGYSEVDGVLVLAPQHTQVIDHLFDRLNAERWTAEAMLRLLQEAAVEREAKVSAALRAWWQNVADDLDIDLTAGWEYLPSSGAIRWREAGPAALTSSGDRL